MAFQIALKDGNPGSVMCSYNKVNGVYSCENDYLLNKVLKGDWGFEGYVMSDWGGTHSTVPAVNNGLDQESAYGFDKAFYFGPALKEAVDNGWVAPARLDDMVRRVLRSMFAQGLFDQPLKDEPIDFAAHAKLLSKPRERHSLIKNAQNILPLNQAVKKLPSSVATRMWPYCPAAVHRRCTAKVATRENGAAEHVPQGVSPLIAPASTARLITGQPNRI